MNRISHAIIGAGGSMGTALRALLSATGAPVVGVDKRWNPNIDLTRARECDAIWLSIPRRQVPRTISQLGQLKASQVVIDLCSLKRRVPKLVQRTGATHLSVHPMHGPHIRHDRQKWFLIGDRHSLPPNADAIVGFLEGFGITFLEIASAAEHDFFMGILLGIKEVTTLVVDRLIAAYARGHERPVPSLQTLLDYASPVANASFGAYIHSILRSGDDLRCELVTASLGNLRLTAVEALRTLAQDLPSMDLECQFAAQRSRVEAEVSSARQNEISAFINNWFENASQEFIVQHRASSSLQTARLTLRPFHEIDRADLLRVLRSRETMRWVFAGRTMDEAAANDFIDREFRDDGVLLPGLGVLCRKEDGSVLGFAGIIPCKPHLNGEFEFGVVLARTGEGYGTEISKTLIDFALGPMGLKRVYALCHPCNTRSVKLLKSLKMTSAGAPIENYHGSEPRLAFVTSGLNVTP